ncbi:MAG: hypothetical protein NZ846_06940 [Thermus sp.]|uniref:hypothetical protein n=1 Tax=Thermus sp. TaxID=275 RepID=UPI0025D24308|nr:hypothetical protein [Thermus sp.]MCS7218699.1 hypothetical protein [Thermus sp.]
MEESLEDKIKVALYEVGHRELKGKRVPFRKLLYRGGLGEAPEVVREFWESAKWLYQEKVWEYIRDELDCEVTFVQDGKVLEAVFGNPDDIRRLRIQAGLGEEDRKEIFLWRLTHWKRELLYQGPIEEAPEPAKGYWKSVLEHYGDPEKAWVYVRAKAPPWTLIYRGYALEVVEDVLLLEEWLRRQEEKSKRRARRSAAPGSDLEPWAEGQNSSLPKGKN